MGLPVLREKEKGEGVVQANEQDCSGDWYLLNVCVCEYACPKLLLITDSEKHSVFFCEEE